MITIYRHLILALALWACSSTATEEKPWKLVGEAQLTMFIFDIYRSRLYSDDGFYRQGRKPIRLEIHYQRDISADKLVQHTIEQWQHLGIDKVLIQRWATELENIWPDIRKQDTLAFSVNSLGHGEFTHNGQLLEKISDTLFSDAFMAIWLSPNTSRKDLRLQLIGKPSP